MKKEDKNLKARIKWVEEVLGKSCVCGGVFIYIDKDYTFVGCSDCDSQMWFDENQPYKDIEEFYKKSCSKATFED